MVAKIVVDTIDITCTIKAIDVGKMVKPQYEASINLSLLAAFVAFVAFLSHPTIVEEYNQ
jgi:hypothetical protein